MKIAISTGYGTDDPTRASLAMIAAKAACDQGHDVLIWLQGEAAVLANPRVYPSVRGINIPPLEEVMAALLAARVQIWVCEACARGRGMDEAMLVPTATFRSMGQFVAEALQRDRTLGF